MGDVVLSGSFRKAPELLKSEFAQLIAVGYRILSPSNVNPAVEKNWFVYMEGESSNLPEMLEWKHLHAIKRCRFLWLFAPEGYVGLSAALEIGFAIALGVPVYSRNAPADPALRPFVHVVSGPDAVPSG